MNLIEALDTTGFSYSSEAEIQDQIEFVLQHYGIPYEREVDLGSLGRIDFIVNGNIGLEVKIAGPKNTVARQLLRYAESDRIDQLVLATTKAVHRWSAKSFGGKPLQIVLLKPEL